MRRVARGGPRRVGGLGLFRRVIGITPGVRIRRLPVFQWIIAQLKEREDNRLSVDTLREALGRDVLPEEVEPQLNIIVDWGRYAEIFAYDDNTEMIYLEPGSAA